MAVASKPHYFCELRVVPSVRALLRHVSHFWRSDELAASLATGDFLALDYGHWGRVGGAAGVQGSRIRWPHHMAAWPYGLCPLGWLSCCGDAGLLQMVACDRWQVMSAG